MSAINQKVKIVLTGFDKEMLGYDSISFEGKLKRVVQDDGTETISFKINDETYLIDIDDKSIYLLSEYEQEEETPVIDVVIEVPDLSGVSSTNRVASTKYKVKELATGKEYDSFYDLFASYDSEAIAKLDLSKTKIRISQTYPLSFIVNECAYNQIAELDRWGYLPLMAVHMSKATLVLLQRAGSANLYYLGN